VLERREADASDAHTHEGSRDSPCYACFHVQAKPGQDYMKRHLEHSALFFVEVCAVLLVITCMKLSQESGIQSARVTIRRSQFDI